MSFADNPLPQIAAFLARMSGPRPVYGDRVEERAREALAKLESAKDDLARRVVLINIGRNADLMDEEEALSEDVLRLQCLVFDAIESSPDLKPFFPWFLEAKAPIHKLVAAILSQAITDGAFTARLEFRESICVQFLVGESWSEAMTMPANLGPPVRGYLLRLSAIGLERFRPYLAQELPMRNLQFEGLREDVLTMTWERAGHVQESG